MSKRSPSVVAATLALAFAGEAAANADCGGLNQRACKKWEQLRGCDPGFHRTKPFGGICTRNNEFIPDAIERMLAPRPGPPATSDVVERPRPSPPAHAAPAKPSKKGLLPHVSQVPAGAPTAMDGLWKLTINGIPYKIEAGRLFAMAAYKHLMVFPVEAHDVVVRDIVQTGPGQLSGQDLALLGPWSARLQADGTIAISVQGAMGPFEGTLVPIQASDPAWLAQETVAVAGGYARPDFAPPRPISGPPRVLPQPPGHRAPPPAVAPGGGDGYPPGWGQ